MGAMGEYAAAGTQPDSCIKGSRHLYRGRTMVVVCVLGGRVFG